MTFLNVYLSSGPHKKWSIGDGWRIVFVKKGTKWVHVWCPFTLRHDRARISEWANIERDSKPAIVRLKYINKTARFTRAHRKLAKTEKSAIRDMRACIRGAT